MNGKADEGSSRATPPRARPGPDDRDDEISPIAVLNVLLRNRRAMVLAPIVTAFLVVTVTLLLPRTWMSSASFTTQSGDSPISSLMGLAMQFGVNIPSPEGAQSPEFYADLLRSREILGKAVATEYDVPVDPEAAGGGRLRGDLITLFEVERDSPAEARVVAIDMLRERVQVFVDPETALVRLSVVTLWPALSERLVDRLLELMNEFNLETRQTRAAAERAFIEERLALAEAELGEAEGNLQRFLQANRRYENSPELLFEFERLQRRVLLRQQVFSSLSEAYEQARVEEVRNTPVLTIVETPELPARPERRYLILKGLAGLLLGATLALVWAFGREMLSSTRVRSADEYAELRRLRTEAAAELRGAWRRIRRPFGERRSA